MKRTLVRRLRERNMSAIIHARTLRWSSFNPSYISENIESRIEALEESMAENVDQKFLQRCMNYDVFSVYDCYLNTLKSGAFSRDTIPGRFMGRIRQLLNLVQPSERRTELKDLKNHILSLRTTALTQLSGHREAALVAEIKQLKEKVNKLEEDLRGYDRIVSDVSFRHLLEMLPLAEHAASRKKIKLVSPSGPEWQAFLGRVWPAAAKKPGPLYELRENSSQVRRDQIEEEGRRLYATPSANVHASEKDYNPMRSQRDYTQGLILDALKPTHMVNGIVDWDREQKRFVGSDKDECDEIDREKIKDDKDEGNNVAEEAKNDGNESKWESDPSGKNSQKKDKKKKKKLKNQQK